MVHHALHHVAWRELDYLFIENVGNLVCPAIYDLGQAVNVVALSVTEGEDKPLKYPVMFRKADLVLLTKIDLLPAPRRPGRGLPGRARARDARPRARPGLGPLRRRASRSGSPGSRRVAQASLRGVAAHGQLHAHSHALARPDATGRVRLGPREGIRMASVALDGGRFGVATEDLTRQGTWLVSRSYDLAFIILSAAFVVFPHLSYAVLGKNIYVDLTVTLLIGGPHLFATYTMTVMEPRFRERWPRYTLGALLLPPLIVTLAILNLTLLVTIFFLWASVHVIHQVAYVTDAYRMKDPRGWDWTSRIIDYGLLATAMYPIATEKFIKGQFQTGGRTLLFPEFLKQPWVAWPVWAAFIGFALAFLWKSVREWREGRLHPARRC